MCILLYIIIIISIHGPGPARARAHHMCGALSEGPSADGPPDPSDGQRTALRLPHMGRVQARARPRNNNKK